MFNLKCNHNACIADGASAMTAITLVYAMLLQELCILSYMRVEWKMDSSLCKLSLSVLTLD
jgi:hypothetical protein